MYVICTRVAFGIFYCPCLPNMGLGCHTKVCHWSISGAQKSEIKVNWSLKAHRSITIREYVGAYLMQDITLLYYFVAYGYIVSWFIELKLCVFMH